MFADYPLLTILIFLPLAGCLLLLPFWNRATIARPVAFGVAAVELALTGWLYASWQFQNKIASKLEAF